MYTLTQLQAHRNEGREVMHEEVHMWSRFHIIIKPVKDESHISDPGGNKAFGLQFPRSNESIGRGVDILNVVPHFFRCLIEGAKVL